MSLGVGERAGGLLPLLDVHARDVDVFHAPVAPGSELSRGIVGAQGLVAAGRTVDTDWRWVHSVHVNHLSVGDANRLVEYRIERVRDSDALSTRLVRAVQGSALLATMSVSFHAPQPGRGPTHEPIASDDWPNPYALSASEAGAALDVRYVDRVPWYSAAPVSANRIWLRVTEEIPDRIVLHAAALVYAADLLLVEPLVGAQQARGDVLRAETVDLSIRFHRGFRADDWLRHEHEVPTAAHHRALTTGRFFSSMGRLVASVSQETVLLSIRGEDEKSIVVNVNGSDNGSREE